MKQTLMLSLVLSLSGCANVWMPPELEEVIADPRFAETAKIEHEGNLDGLPGCWGSLRERDGGLDAVFYQFDADGAFLSLTLTEQMTGFGRLQLVTRVGGTWEPGNDGASMVLTLADFMATDYDTGQLVPIPDSPERTGTYAVTVDGDAMQMEIPASEDPQYDGTLWRFGECP